MRVGGLFLKVFASGVALALLLIYLDERKLGKIKAGLPVDTVRQLLGPPQWLGAGSECKVYFHEDRRKDEIVECSIYERAFRRDLIVGFDHAGRVICTGRVSTFHLVS
jgi:hypothetical protein